MKTLCSSLWWTLVLMLLLFAVDQLLVRMPVTAPVPLAVATFYRDLRSRTLELVGKAGPAPAPAPSPSARPPAPAKTRQSPPPSIETLIEQRQAGPAGVAQPSLAPPNLPSASLPGSESALRYVYADDLGALHFAGSLAEIPAQFRARARLLGE